MSLEALILQLEAALAAARAMQASQASMAPEMLDSRQSHERYGIGRDGLLAAAARGELQLQRGPRQKILVERAELERWLRSRPLQPRARRRSAEVVDLAAWDREQERELRALGGER